MKDHAQKQFKTTLFKWRKSQSNSLEVFTNFAKTSIQIDLTAKYKILLQSEKTITAFNGYHYWKAKMNKLGSKTSTNVVVKRRKMYNNIWPSQIHIYWHVFAVSFNCISTYWIHRNQDNSLFCRIASTWFAFSNKQTIVKGSKVSPTHMNYWAHIRFSSLVSGITT